MENNLIEGLKKNIENLKNENNLKKKEIEKKENECNKIIDDFLNKNLIFNNNNINKINDLYKKIQKNIKQKFINYEIIYKIEEKDLKKNIESVKINADFLKWSYKEMEKTEDNKNFIYRTKLLLGHSYYFCFYIKGDKKFSNNYEIKRLKKKNNLKYNYIEIKDENGNVQNDDENESEEEENEEDENEEEDDLFNINENKEFLDNYFNFINLIFKEKNEFTKIKENFERKIRNYYENLLIKNNKMLDKNIDKNKKKNVEKFLYRIIKQNNNYYLIEEIDNYNNFQFKAIPLYDENNIKINIKENEKIRQYLKFDFKDLFYKYEILNNKESMKIKNEFGADNKNILQIKYNLIKDGNFYSIVPTSCKPENINLIEYEIIIKNNLIREVKNKKNNFIIYFISKNNGEIDDIKLMNDELKIYTTMYDKNTINILHFHLNDISEDITIEANYLEEEEKILNYKFSNKDISGRDLTYRLIFQNRKLQKIYYFQSQNVIEPDFKEIRFTPNSIVKVLEGKYKNYHGKIHSFPKGYLCSKNYDDDNNKSKDLSDFKDYVQVEECKERSLAELFGFIPIDLMYKTDNKNENIEELDEKIKILIQCCKLYPLSVDEDQLKFEKKILINQQNKKKDEIKKITDAVNICKKYEKYVLNNNLIDELNFEQCNKSFEELNEINENFNDEFNEYENEIKFIKNIKENVINLIQRRLRILKFK